jgi:hypothetical protein
VAGDGCASSSDSHAVINRQTVAAQSGEHARQVFSHGSMEDESPHRPTRMSGRERPVRRTFVAWRLCAISLEFVGHTGNLLGDGQPRTSPSSQLHHTYGVSATQRSYTYERSSSRTRATETKVHGPNYRSRREQKRNGRVAPSARLPRKSLILPSLLKMGRVGIEPTTLGLKGKNRASNRREFPRKINDLGHRSAGGR